MADLVIKDGKFFIDGKATQIISGAMHYFRIHPGLWRDRLLKAKQCGLNCVETYMCWNLHEPVEGRFDFSGILDFEEFIRQAAEIGLMVMVRPGPYICAEWDNGGFPAWLMNKERIRFRCMNDVYITALTNYLNVILPKLVQLQSTKGGPIIAMQVENEYGSYGNDHEYIDYIKQCYRDNGIEIPLYTSDGPEDYLINGGTRPDMLMTLNFGSAPLERFANGRRQRPQGPDFCMEFWNGWFDRWGGEHHGRSTEEVKKDLDDLLSNGGSINFYMFHGGTNFAFYNGANFVDGDLWPDVTSYDYDAPLSECGDPTEKYFAYQEIIKKHFPDREITTPEVSEKIAYPEVKFTASGDLFENMGNIGSFFKYATPEPMEFWGQNFGFIHYSTTIQAPLFTSYPLIFRSLHDRAQIYLNGEYLGVIYRNDKDQHLMLPTLDKDAKLDILVEGMGRINYGPLLGRDCKGIGDGVCINGQYQFKWDITTLPCDNIEKVNYGKFGQSENKPAFHRATLHISGTVADTFIEFPGVKGVVWVNGFNIGRYWNIGPGKTLYVPRTLLHEGENEIVVLELHQLAGDGVKFVAQADLAFVKKTE